LKEKALPTETNETKRLTRLRDSFGRSRTESAARGSAKYVEDTSLVPNLYAGQCRREVYTRPLRAFFGKRNVVPVIAKDQEPLMPCSEKRARLMVKSGKATPFWNRGIFCIRLNVEPSSRKTPPVVVGIDPGSKKEGYTVKSAHHTYLNIQADAVTWVKDHVEVRRNMRRARRFRKTPYRQNRINRARGGLPPSTRARWSWKLRLAAWLSKLYPISQFVVEDIKAKTKGKRCWDASFSPLEVGKQWFYGELEKLAPVETRQGWETKRLRYLHGLKKSGAKMAEKFSAHCVDSWVLANEITGGHTKPDNERMLLVTPLRFHRRQLHALQPAKGGARRPYGGTRSCGFKRGSLVRHPKYGVAYVGGTERGRITLTRDGGRERLCRNAKPADCKWLAYTSWRTRLLPGPKAGVPVA